MDEKIIRKIALMSFLVSFSILFVINDYYKPQLREINDISIRDLNKNIRVQGKILNEVLLNENLFLTIKDESGLIKAVAFKTTEKLDKNEEYEVTGKLTLYNQEFELIVNKVEVIKP